MENVFNNLDALRMANPDPIPKLVHVLGHTTINDGGGGEFYWDANDTTGDDNAITIKPSDILNNDPGRFKRLLPGDHVKASWFGALGDGVVDDTEALQKAMAYVNADRTAPVGGSGRGQNILILDKGEYKVTDSLIEPNATSYIGFTVQGAGEFATQITFENDSNNLFNFRTHLNTTFKNFSIYHNPIDQNRANWTNSAFFQTGESGGRRFTLENITITNFDIQIRHDDSFNANNDTNLAIGCTFSGFNTFLMSRNTQAVVNEYLQCSWTGGGDIFDIAGFGHLQINGGNVVVGGTWFKFANIQNNYGSSTVYTLSNVKGEYALDHNGNVSTRIIDANGASIGFGMIFDNCGISGGSASPDPNHSTFVFGAGETRVTFNNGSYESTILETISRTALNNPNTNFIKFIGCEASPNPNQIIRTDSGTPGSGHVAITYIDCNNRTNITMMYKSPLGRSQHTNTLTRLQASDGRLTVNTSPNGVDVPFYGQETIIDEIMVAFNDYTINAQDIKIIAYSDQQRTNVLDTLNLQGNPSSGPVGFFENIRGTKLIEGIYFDVENRNGRSFGKIVIKSFNI